MLDVHELCANQVRVEGTTRGANQDGDMSVCISHVSSHSGPMVPLDSTLKVMGIHDWILKKATDMIRVKS